MLDWRQETIRHFAKSLEEFVEMLGMSIFLVTFLGHLAVTAPMVTVSFQEGSDRQGQPRIHE